MRAFLTFYFFGSLLAVAGSLFAASDCADDLRDLTQFVVRPVSLGDLAELLIVENEAWQELAATAGKLISRTEIFPEGQLLAMDSTQKVVGFLNTQRLTEQRIYESLESHTGDSDHWGVLSGDGFISSSHDPQGDVLFMINLTTRISKDGQSRRRNIGAVLVQSAIDFARKMNVSKIYGLTRLNGFRGFMREHPAADIHEYIRSVISGRWRDPALSFHLKQGARFLTPVFNSMKDDIESHTWGALICYDLTNSVSGR